jgi:osmoprotectant transport system permease protein
MRVLFILMSFISLFAQAQKIKVGAKHFNEGYIVSEIIAQLLEHSGFEVERVYHLGGTMVCFSALEQGGIDIYPEYTGTIASEILKSEKHISYEEIQRLIGYLKKMEMSPPFGFNNTYALVMKRKTSMANDLLAISSLQDHPNLKIGLSYEFLKRNDGWLNLSGVYQLKQKPKGLEHGLAYQALNSGKIDVTDAYSTDGEISRYGLEVLVDDRSFFPDYEAVALYHSNLNPKVKGIVARLKDQMSEKEMQRMNAAVLYGKKTFAEVAGEFLREKGLIRDAKPVVKESMLAEISQKTIQHLSLTFTALFIAVLVAIPLGVLIYKTPQISNTVLYIVGLFQTIPSIALLAVMIPITNIGILPTIIALFIYALLPIVRNTVAGLLSVDPLLKNIASGMGMTPFQKMKWVEFPLALPTMLAGIRTAAVINVGTATLAAFIGAGGLGEFIVTGLALNNTQLILQGAIPAAMLALLMELLFTLLEKTILPAHLKNLSASV